MSRIDEALRRAADAGAVKRDGTNRAPDRASMLDLYSDEGVCAPERVAETLPALELRRVNVTAAPERRPVVARDAYGKLVGMGGGTGVPVEQYRSLAAALHEGQAERGLKMVTVTSSVPREGKTLTVVNLAITLSESYGRRVLVIDADLRWPSVHGYLGIPNGSGLSEALASGRGHVPLVEVTPLLTVLSSGRPSTNPLAGLSSARMPALLDECASQFDWVLVDTPPVGILPDAQLIARLTQGVVFVIGAGSTPFPVIERAIAELGRECIIGTVLNGVDERAIPSASHYSHYYRPAQPAQ
jgi:capsular exopolysaccharide synthesis family protein